MSFFGPSGSGLHSWRKHLGRVGIIALFLWTGSPALAQRQQQSSTLPAFAFPKDAAREQAAKENWTLKPVPIPPVKNSYLSGILTLQEQINLIDKLAEREKVLSDLETAYQNLGIPFTAPPPPREICAKIPPSVSCIQAWPDLLKMDTPETSEPAPLPEETAPVAKAPEPRATEETPPPYRWTDVSCAGGRCRAVLVHEEDARTRRTVSEGDTLPDGLTVSKIAFEGVRVSHGEKVWALMPAVAPSRGGSASPLFASSRPPSSSRRAPSPATASPSRKPATATPSAKETPPKEDLEQEKTRISADAARQAARNADRLP